MQRTIYNYRTSAEACFGEVFSNAQACGDQCNVEMGDPLIRKHRQHRGNALAESAEKYIRKPVYIPFIDLKEIASDIKEIKEARLVDIEKELDSLSALEEKVTSFEDQFKRMPNVIQALESKTEDLENHSRCSNLLIYGLPEKDEETNLVLETAVKKEIFQDILELDSIEI